ncbi:MAG: dihydroorotate dehydrogenase, partial [Candidatus Hodarchaeota archaeon]
LTPNITDITEIGVAAVKGGADALVAINTVKAMLIDIKTRLPILSNYRGGLSGSAIKPIGVRAIFDLYESLGSSIPLVGVGGISKWEDIIEYILAGANAVQFGSVLSFKDPKAIINHFREKLSSYLQQEEIDLDQLRGLAHE